MRPAGTRSTWGSISASTTFTYRVVDAAAAGHEIRADRAVREPRVVAVV